MLPDSSKERRGCLTRYQNTYQMVSGNDKITCCRPNTSREPIYADLAVRYDLLMNGSLSREARYATLVHELAHLYCGHLGTPNDKWWPDRRGLDHDVREFEAESVTYLVCSRFGIDNPSEQYLSGFVGKHEQVPSISLECVLKTAGLIENMSSQKMKARKQADETAT